jgi:hypothetical protein
MDEFWRPLTFFLIGFFLLLFLLRPRLDPSRGVQVEIPPDVAKDRRRKASAVRKQRWIKALLAVLLGNAAYHFSLPSLPPAMRHEPFKADLGILVDLWFCLFVYGLIELGLYLWRRRRRS